MENENGYRIFKEWDEINMLIVVVSGDGMKHLFS